MYLESGTNFQRHGISLTRLWVKKMIRFRLELDNQFVGTLGVSQVDYCPDAFVFKYGEDFKDRIDNEPIIGFPDLDKEYTSRVLWPFFAIRIPSKKRPDIKAIFEDEGIDSSNIAQMLERFGPRCISNPYKLIRHDNDEEQLSRQALIDYLAPSVEQAKNGIFSDMTLQQIVDEVRKKRDANKGVEQ